MNSNRGSCVLKKTHKNKLESKFFSPMDEIKQVALRYNKISKKTKKHHKLKMKPKTFIHAFPIWRRRVVDITFGMITCHALIIFRQYSPDFTQKRNFEKHAHHYIFVKCSTNFSDISD